jgi:hypothetical protein
VVVQPGAKYKHTMLYEFSAWLKMLPKLKCLQPQYL